MHLGILGKCIFLVKYNNIFLSCVADSGWVCLALVFSWSWRATVSRVGVSKACSEGSYIMMGFTRCAVSKKGIRVHRAAVCGQGDGCVFQWTPELHWRGRHSKTCCEWVHSCRSVLFFTGILVTCVPVAIIVFAFCISWTFSSHLTRISREADFRPPRIPRCCT
jgi:hypothetical protein